MFFFRKYIVEYFRNYFNIDIILINFINIFYIIIVCLFVLFISLKNKKVKYFYLFLREYFLLLDRKEEKEVRI